MIAILAMPENPTDLAQQMCPGEVQRFGQQGHPFSLTPSRRSRHFQNDVTIEIATGQQLADLDGRLGPPPGNKMLVSGGAIAITEMEMD
jgi:hypothetical protein